MAKEGSFTHHLEKLVALVKVRHEDTLALGDGSVYPDELAIFAHRINLM